MRINLLSLVSQAVDLGVPRLAGTVVGLFGVRRGSTDCAGGGRFGLRCGWDGDGAEHVGTDNVVAEMSPRLSKLEEMRQRRIPVVIGADAHDPPRVAVNSEDALDALNSVGYTEISMFLNRVRLDISIDLARDSLRS